MAHTGIHSDDHREPYRFGPRFARDGYHQRGRRRNFGSFSNKMPSLCRIKAEYARWGIKGRRPSLIPSRRARAPYRGTRENNLPTPLCREPPILLTKGHFFHPPLVRGRCLYPPDKGVALVESFFIGHSPRDARPLKGGVVHARRSRNRPQVQFRPSCRSPVIRYPAGAVREPPCLGDEERGDAGIVNGAASGLYVFHDILRY